MIYMNSCTFLGLKFTKETKFTAPKMTKLAVFALQDSSKLNSREIWLIQKSYNFHTVKYLLEYLNHFMRIQNLDKCKKTKNSLLVWIFREFEFNHISLILIIDFIQLLWIIWLRKELFTPFHTSFSVRHSVEIWKKFCHSDFTWNQFL